MKALDKSLGSIINFFISIEELFLMTHVGACIDESQQQKVRTIRTYVDSICAHDTILQSYTNTNRAILQYLQRVGRVSSYTAYRSTLAISHIREIVAMFKVFVSCSNKREEVTAIHRICCITIFHVATLFCGSQTTTGIVP